VQEHPVNVSAILDAGFKDHGALLQATRDAVKEPFTQLVSVCIEAILNENKIILFGNGGSASDAQHIAAELVGRYVSDRVPIPAISLATDSSALTAISNDYGFEHVFERQLTGVGTAGDVAIGLSTSGNSPNVIRALQAARTLKMTPAGFAGNTGGAMQDIASPVLVVPSSETPRIQEMHILLGHLLCAAIEQGLGLTQDDD
tara:strand:- start:7348 stop:7953 length:606 start_codon:yes stop_codon:yes gene_type:complete